VVPDGALATIPWAALMTHQRYLAETGPELQFLGSGRDLLRLRQGKQPTRRQEDAIFSSPEYGQGGPFETLTGSQQEAQTVSAISTNATIFQGSAATASRVSNLVSPRILHIATHGVYDGSGPIALNSSYLAMAGANLGPDGWLTARQMSVINLDETELVVLSSCESALGKTTAADGLLGFQRSLTLAGARSQLLSLWRVNDLATTQFMRVFYTKLLVDKQGRAEALRETQREFIRANRPPSEWAAFVLWGDPSPIDPR
jgi:CHAT domain-containing protein